MRLSISSCTLHTWALITAPVSVQQQVQARLPATCLGLQPLPGFRSGQVWKSKQSYDWDQFPSILQVSKKSTTSTIIPRCNIGFDLLPPTSSSAVCSPLQGITKDAPETHRGLWALKSYSVTVPLLSRNSGVLTSQFHRSYMQHWICALTKFPSTGKLAQGSTGKILNNEATLLCW